MRSLEHFIYIFLNLQVFFADCWPQDGSSNASISNETDSHSTKTNFELCPSNRCLKKCCKAKEIYSWTNRTCLPDLDNELEKANWSANFSQYHIIYDSRCPAKAMLVVKESADDTFTRFSNGSILLEKEERLLDFHEYCEEYLIEDHTSRPQFCYDPVPPPVPEAKESENSWNEFVHVLLCSGLGISVLFLIITAGLYLITPELRARVHDKCIVCHLLSLALGFGFLIGFQIIHKEDLGCVFVGKCIILI